MQAVVVFQVLMICAAGLPLNGDEHNEIAVQVRDARWSFLRSMETSGASTGGTALPACCSNTLCRSSRYSSSLLQSVLAIDVHGPRT